MGTRKERVVTETYFFKAVFVFFVQLLVTKVQWSALQVGQDSSICIFDIIFGSVRRHSLLI